MQERVFDLRIWVQILVATTVKLCKYKYCHSGEKDSGKGVSIHMPPIQIHTYLYIYLYTQLLFAALQQVAISNWGSRIYKLHSTKTFCTYTT